MKAKFLFLPFLFLIFDLTGAEITFPSTETKNLTGQQKDQTSLWKIELKSSVPIDSEKTLHLTTYQFDDDFVVRLTDGGAKFGKNNFMVKNGKYYINEPRLSYVMPMDSLKKFTNKTLMIEFIYKSKTYKLYGIYNSKTKYLDIVVGVG